MLRAKHMGFKSVRRVEVKAETTTPGEVRTTTDATGARVSTSRGRRTLPKLEFTVDEDGAILHGPQRGAFPFYPSAAPSNNSLEAAPAPGPAFATSVERELAASFHTLHMREFPSSAGGEDPATSTGNNNNNQSEEDEREADEGSNQDEAKERASLVHEAAPATPPAPMKECILNDTRATTLAIKYDRMVSKFVCGSSIERFSGHTGVCRVLGSKNYPIIPHSLRIGDLLRIGSVGLVVCEMNRSASDETQESLSEDEYEFLKENYLSLPLQQTFHPTESSRLQHEDEEEDVDEDDKDHSRTRRVGGETSDEGESEEDARAGRDPGNPIGPDGAVKENSRTLGVSGTLGKRFCYICYDGEEEADDNPLVAPCNCKGDTKYVHLECLQRWNNNLDADGSNPNQKVCAMTNTDGLDVCSICKATYLTSVKLEDGRVVSLLAKKLPPPYVTFAVVTQHETRNRSTALTNTRFQLSFANLPRGQQYLTIGRSTTNNMTLRYRTVSQLHAKIKFQDGHFFLFDAGSSNGTMLFLSKPLELDWNKTMHVKIGRTILTLKSKKKWKWSGATDDGGADSDGEAVTSPRLSGLGTPRDAGDLTPRMHFANSFSSSTPRRPGLNRFESDGALSDPSAELLSSPFRGQFAGASGFTVPDGTTPPEDDSADHPTTSQGLAEHPDVPETFNLSEIDDDNRDSTFNARHDGGDPSSSATSPTFRPYLPGNLRSSFPDSTSPSAFGLLQGRVADLPRIRNELRQRREHALYDLVESLARVDTAAAVASSSTSSSAVPAAESSSTAAPTHLPDQQVDKE